MASRVDSAGTPCPDWCNWTEAHWHDEAQAIAAGVVIQKGGFFYCANCGSKMVSTDIGELCSLCDWHTECSGEGCGTPSGSCGVREQAAESFPDLTSKGAIETWLNE